MSATKYDRLSRARTLADQHLDLVYRIARCVQQERPNEDLEMDDLVALGSEGLMQAATRFDPSRGTDFRTYARRRIRGAISDGTGSLGRNWHRSRQRAQKELDDDAAGTLPGARRQVLRCLASLFVEPCDSWEWLLAPPELQPDHIAGRRSRDAQVRRALAALPARERHIVERHYYDGLTLHEAGTELGLSRSRASRLHAQALDRLRRLLARAETPALRDEAA